MSTECEKCKAVQKLVDEQADDEALWAHPASIVEAYTQQELRRLHAEIEDEKWAKEFYRND